MVAPALKVEGLAELRRALKGAERMDDRKELAAGLKAAADVVAQDAKSRVPSVTGRARGAIRATSGGNRAFVVGGKASVPYYGWLDFGGRTPVTGNPRSRGPWAGSGTGPTKGRFIYPAFDARDNEVAHLVAEAVERALTALDL